MDEDKQVRKARDYAYRLLSYRQRSTKEIKQRLEQKGFKPETTRKVIKYLSELNYLNDENFAKFWIQTKIELRPVGWPVLRYQLRQKGVPAGVLEKVLTEYAGRYSEIDLAKKLVASRRKRSKAVQPLVLKRRLYGYLSRRGFSQEAISQAIKETDNIDY